MRPVGGRGEPSVEDWMGRGEVVGVGHGKAGPPGKDDMQIAGDAAASVAIGVDNAEHLGKDKEMYVGVPFGNIDHVLEIAAVCNVAAYMEAERARVVER